MTRDQLQQLLDATSNAMQSLNTALPPATADNILSVLNGVNSNTLDYLLPLIQVANPTMTKDQLVAAIQSSIQLLTSIKQMVSDGDTDKIAAMCDNLKSRPMILSVICRLI